MLKTILATTLSILALSSHADTVISPKPENIYLFDIKDKEKTFEGTYAIGLDENVLLKCDNKNKVPDEIDYSCKFDLKTDNNFNINNEAITGVQILLIPTVIEKDVLRTNIVYRQRIDQTHSINSVMVDKQLKLNKKNEIKLTDDNNLYITVKKEKY